MTKREFIAALRKSLSGLPQQDMEDRLAFYGEMIDDRIEEGYTEEEAVSDVGSVEEVATQIIREIPLARIAKERIKPKKRLRAWEIVLLVLGAPIWLSLLVAAFAVVLSLYAVLWSVVVSLWSVFASLVGCALGGVIGGGILAISGNGLAGIATIGAGLSCAGLSVFLFFGCHAATKGMARLTSAMGLGIKRCFVRKEEA